MTANPADRVVEWEGGSLDDLVTMLCGLGIPARIEVLVAGAAVGEIHLVAGGVAEVIAGDARGDDAMEQLRTQENARFRVETRLPDQFNGSLTKPGLFEGNLAERSVTDLMRYCEDYALTCALEVWRGDDRATLDYRRGELASAAVNGSEAEDALPEVMAWSAGHYRLVLPPIVLPAPGRRAEPHRARPATARPNRETVPLVPTNAARGTHPGMPVDVFGRSQPERTTDVGPAIAPPIAPTPLQPSAQRAPAAAPRMLTTLPARPAPVVPAAAPRAAPSAGPAPAHKASRGSSAPTPPPPRSLADLPVMVHVLLGLAVGGAVVGGYWVFQVFASR